MIEVTLEMSDLEIMQSKHTMSHIFHKNFGSWFPVAKTLIEYNCNCSEENIEEESQFILSLLSKTLILK